MAIVRSGIHGVSLRRISRGLPGAMASPLFRALAQASSDIIAVLSPPGSIRYVSPSLEGVLGYAGETLTGEGVALIHPDDRELAGAAFARVLGTSEGVEHLELRMRHADGGWVWLDVLATNLLEHADVRGIVFTGRDITERKRAETVTRSLEQLGHELVGTADVAEATHRIATTGLDLFGGVRASVFRLDPAARALVCVAAAGTGRDAVLGQRLALGSGAAGRALVLRRVFCTPDILADPNLAYVSLAMLFSAATTVTVYWLARALYDRATAASAAALLAVSPLFWFYGSVGLTYAGEAFGASLVAAFAYGTLRGHTRFLYGGAVALGLAGGIRPSVLVLLLPLSVGCALVGIRGARRLALAAVLMLGAVLSWLLPLVWLTGGLDAYLRASTQLYGSVILPTSVLGGSLALRLGGKFATAFPEGQPKTDSPAAKGAKPKPEPAPAPALKETAKDNSVVLVADVDMLNDGAAVDIQEVFGRRVVVPSNGNLAFAQSLVEQLASGDDLISLRSRASAFRPLSVVRQMEADAQKEYFGKIQSIETELQKTTEKLQDLQKARGAAAKSAQSAQILTPQQQEEIDRFRKRVAETRKELKELRKNLRQDAEQLVLWTKIANIALMPLLVALAGLAVALVRRRRQAAA